MPDSPSPTPRPDSPVAMGRLMARERVRAMESLAGTIAHEIRSAVLGVTSAAQLLRYSLPADPVAEKSLGRILQESERLSSLHEALSEYATEVPPRFVLVDPDELWRKVLAAMRGALEASSVSANHTPSPSLAKCLVDEEQMTRAFERIMHHAIARSRPASTILVSSAIDSLGGWQSTITALNAQQPDHRSGGGDFERPTFLIALAHRTIVAHGGEVVDDSIEHSPLHISVRLPGPEKQ